MGNLLNIVASTTRRIPLISTTLAEQRLLPEFARTDGMAGTLEVVEETSDPTAPTSPVAIESSPGIGLTDGVSIVYANAIILGVSDGNKVSFTIMVDSAALQAALLATANDYLDAFLEARVVTTGQDMLLLREPVLIRKAASAGGALGVTGVGVPGLIFNWVITVKEQIDTLPNVATYATLTVLITSFVVNGVREKFIWQLLEDDANPANPETERQADPGRHWQLIG